VAGDLVSAFGLPSAMKVSSGEPRVSGDRDVVSDERHVDAVTVPGDLAGGHGCDACHVLAEEQDQAACAPVGDLDAVTAQRPGHQVPVLAVIDRGCGAPKQQGMSNGCQCRDGHRGQQPGEPLLGLDAFFIGGGGTAPTTSICRRWPAARGRRC
jgi:hypothetical protein